MHRDVSILNFCILAIGNSFDNIYLYIYLHLYIFTLSTSRSHDPTPESAVARRSDRVVWRKFHKFFIRVLDCI